MNGFDECGIRYLTAKSITAYRECPGAWVMHYLFGHKQAGGPALIRGIAIKTAVKHWLYQGDLGAAEDLLDDAWQMKAKELGIDTQAPDARSEHSTLLALFSRTVQALQGLGLGSESGKLPLASDLPQSFLVDGIEIPFLCSPSFVFEDCILELKAGKQCYSSIQDRDLHGLAVVSRAYPDRPIRMLYTTHAKAADHVPLPAMLDIAWINLVVDAMALQTFIKTAESREHALAMVPLNFTHFRWDAALLAKAGDVLGLTQERLYGIASAKAERLRDTRARDASRDLLPHPGSWDAHLDGEG